MTNKSYSNLGLSADDIVQIKKHNLTHVLDKIRDQQNQLKKHEKKLQHALDKIEKDLAAARDAQMSLLPKELTGIPNVEFKARFYPSQFVSGDIYNVFRLDEFNIGVYHIDISGHGVPAALFSVSLSQMLNTNISKKNLLKVPAKEPPYYKINAPDKVIGILNEDQSFEQNGIYFTMVYMILSFRDNIVRYARAGHNPPVLIKANGEVFITDEGSFPVGWDFPRDDKVVTFNTEEGSRIYMFSDGITEACNARGDLFTRERMIDILRENRHKSLDECLDLVIAGVREFSGSNDFEDDVSIVGLGCKNEK